MIKDVQTPFQKTLEFLMQKAKVNLLQLERNTNVPKSTIHSMLKDPTLEPRISSLRPLAQFFQITISQLLGEDPLPHAQKGKYKENKNYWKKIPLLTWEQAITWPKTKSILKTISTIQTDSEVGKQAFGLQMQESLSDGFLNNAIVIFDPNANPHENDYVLVYKKNSKLPSIKQFKIYDNETYLRPLNEQLPAVVLDKNYKILAVAKQIRFDFDKLTSN